MKLKLALLIIVFVFLFSGCSFGLKTVDELILPPKAYGENEGIQTAIDENLESGYVLKSPTSGSYTSAFVLFDIDKDGTDEALAFYQPRKTVDQVNFMVLKYEKSKWNCVKEIEGQGSDVNSVEFGDLNGDGVNEIIVSWQMFNNKEKRVLSIYDYDKSKNSINTIETGVTFTSMVVLDINLDSIDELLLFTIDSAKTPIQANARLFTLTKSELTQLGVATLDPNVTSYRNIAVQDSKALNSLVVYIDGYKGENLMVTEVVYWDNESKTLSAPLYDASTQSTPLTSKGIRVKSRDVNEDGVIEVATQGALAGAVDQNVLVVNWNQLSNLQLNTVEKSVINEKDGYMIMLNDVTAGKSTAIYNEKKRELILCEWDFENNVIGNEIYSIRAVKKSVWNNEQIKGYSVIGNNADLVYVAKINNIGNNLQTTVEQLSEQIIVYK